MQAARAALVGAMPTDAVKQYAELLGCASVSGLQLLTLCPALLSLLGTPQMEELAVQAVALLQGAHRALQCSEVRVIAEQVSNTTAHTHSHATTSTRAHLCCCGALSQTLSLLASPACGALLQQLSEFVLAVLRFCQTQQYAAANQQLANTLQTILQQLSATRPLGIAPTCSATADSAHSPAASIESGEWSDMLLCCYQLHCSQQLSTTEWLSARALLDARDERVLALWRRWKDRLAKREQQHVREQSEQYWLAGEGGTIDTTGREAEADSGGFVAGMQALLVEVAEETEQSSCDESS